jgi:DNA-binding XRE family transcriptional regulator
MFGIIRSTAHEISIGVYEESLNINVKYCHCLRRRMKELLLELMHSLKT